VVATESRSHFGDSLRCQCQAAKSHNVDRLADYVQSQHGKVVTPFLGEDFFPKVDAGQFRLHVSAPVGTRIEETQQVFYQVENA
jgi:hypothetical protein